MKKAFGFAALIALTGCGGGGEPEGRNMSASEVASELASVKIRPGQWEATNEILEASAAGMPPGMFEQMAGTKTQVANCVTPEQAEKPDANFLAAQENADCTYQDFTMSGGRMKGTMICRGGEMPGEMRMLMDGRYGPESYDMTMDMTTTGIGEGMTMNIKARTTGRRTGDCT